MSARMCICTSGGLNKVQTTGPASTGDASIADHVSVVQTYLCCATKCHSSNGSRSHAVDWAGDKRTLSPRKQQPSSHTIDARARFAAEHARITCSNAAMRNSQRYYKLVSSAASLLLRAAWPQVGCIIRSPAQPPRRQTARCSRKQLAHHSLS